MTEDPAKVELIHAKKRAGDPHWLPPIPDSAVVEIIAAGQTFSNEYATEKEAKKVANRFALEVEDARWGRRMVRGGDDDGIL